MSTPKNIHRLDYLNHRNERSIRHVQPRKIRFGKSDWHQSDQWLLECYDHDREGTRKYALRNVITWQHSSSQAQCGIYRHFKGKYYLVVGTAKHSETLELMIRYRSLYGEFDEWVRPAQMFHDVVELEDGSTCPRFKLVEGHISPFPDSMIWKT